MSKDVAEQAHKEGAREPELLDSFNMAALEAIRQQIAVINAPDVDTDELIVTAKKSSGKREGQPAAAALEASEAAIRSEQELRPVIGKAKNALIISPPETGATAVVPLGIREVAPAETEIGLEIPKPPGEDSNFGEEETVRLFEYPLTPKEFSSVPLVGPELESAISYEPGAQTLFELDTELEIEPEIYEDEVAESVVLNELLADLETDSTGLEESATTKKVNEISIGNEKPVAVSPAKKVIGLFEEQIALIESPEEEAVAAAVLGTVVELAAQVRELEASEPDQAEQLIERLEQVCIELMAQLNIEYDEASLKKLVEYLLLDESQLENSDSEPIENFWHKWTREVSAGNPTGLAGFWRRLPKDLVFSHSKLGNLALAAMA